MTTDEAEGEDEEELEEYEPSPVLLSEGDFFLMDIEALSELCDAVFYQIKDDTLWVWNSKGKCSKVSDVLSASAPKTTLSRVN